MDMSEEMRLKLEADCNSLNAIATTLRHEGRNESAYCLLAIEKHIFQLIDSTFHDVLLAKEYLSKVKCCDECFCEY